MLEPCAVKVASTVLRRGLHREMGFLSDNNYKAERRREKLEHFFGIETDTDKAIRLEEKRKAAILKEVNSIDLSKDGNSTNISQTIGAYIARKKR